MKVKRADRVHERHQEAHSPGEDAGLQGPVIMKMVEARDPAVSQRWQKYVASRMKQFCAVR